MILVYTNSRERAMRLATAIDGVVLRNKQKIRPSNYDSLRDILEQELITDGYVRAFFRGMPYVFLYSDGPIKAPCKMVDYDASYASFKDRPIPFLPNQFEYRYVDAGFEARLAKYHDIIHDAAEIVNAASDDIEGELCFLQFMNEVEASGNSQKFPLGTIKAAHPCTMNEADVMNAFALPDTWYSDVGSPAAAKRREYIEWLVTCNATNALTKNNLSRRLIPVGRLESVILTLIAEQNRDESQLISPAKAVYNGTVKLSLPAPYTIHGKSEVDARILSGFPTTEKAGTSAITKIKGIGTVTVANTEHSLQSGTPRLLNISTLQQRACDALGLTLTETASAVEWLYFNGFITWPTDSDRNPWNNKSRVTKAVSALNADPSMAERIIPRDVENFLQWDNDDNNDQRTGVIVTEKPLPSSAPQKCAAVYQIIADALIDTIKARSFTDIITVYITCGDYKLVITDSLAGTQQYQPTRDVPIPAGTAIPITDCALLSKDRPPRYTTKRIIETLLAITSGHAYWNDSRVFSSALDTLTVWKQIELDETDGTYRITERGKQAYNYIRNTILADIPEIVSWDLRLSAIAHTSRQFPEGGSISSFCNDVRAYVSDIVASIEETCNTMRELGGYVPSDFACPVCGGELHFPDEGGCSCLNCKFNIPSKVFGHTMKVADIGALVTKGETTLITDFVSAKGTYAARLVLNQGKVSRTFESPYPCPKCGKKLNEYAWGVKCADTNCSFSLNTTIRGHHLTEDELMALVCHKETEPLSMVSQKGVPFKAKLRIADNGALQFDLQK